MSKKRQAGKPADRPDEKPAKLTLTLPVDLAKRFGVHAEMVGLSKSELFAELVRAGCRRFVVSDRQAREGEEAPEAGRDGGEDERPPNRRDPRSSPPDPQDPARRRED